MGQHPVSGDVGYGVLGILGEIFRDPDVCRRDLDRIITLAELRRTKSLLPLELSNYVSVLSDLLVSHGMELNTHYTNLVASKAFTKEKLNRKWRYVKELCFEVTTLDKKLEKVQRGWSILDKENKELRYHELVWNDAKLSDQALVVRDLQNEISLKRLLSSDEFNASLARVLFVGITSGVERGLYLGRTNVEFEAAAQNVSNFFVGAEVKFNKALAAFPSTQFPFLGKVTAVAEGALSEVVKILPDKIVHSTTHAPTASLATSEVLNQTPIGHAPDGLPSIF
nr:hypothetical protein [Tanacetum cinerariifolium]